MRMMEITKTTNKTYTVYAIMRNFCTFDKSFRDIRRKFHNDKSMQCFKCNFHFKDGDNVNIFAMKKDGNKLCCDRCADGWETCKGTGKVKIGLISVAARKNKS